MWYLILFLGLELVELASTHSRSIKCNNDSTVPTDLHDQYVEWLGDEKLHPSFQLLPGIIKSFGFRDKNAREMRGNMAHLNGHRQCSSRQQKDHGDNLNDRSLCPYYFLFNYDRNRYPSRITTARCTCDRVQYLQFKSTTCKCKESGRSCKRRCNRKENILAPTCTEIPYMYKVLKQKYDADENTLCDDKNNFIYVRTYETVNIGCIPVLPKSDVAYHNTVTVSEN